MDNSLRQCERDVEAARAKLAQDLARLRSPATAASFTESLKDTALNAKDAVIEQAKDAVRSKVSSFVDETQSESRRQPGRRIDHRRRDRLACGPPSADRYRTDWSRPLQPMAKPSRPFRHQLFRTRQRAANGAGERARRERQGHRL